MSRNRDIDEGKIYFPVMGTEKGISLGGRHFLSLQTIKLSVPFTVVAAEVLMVTFCTKSTFLV